MNYYMEWDLGRLPSIAILDTNSSHEQLHILPAGPIFCQQYVPISIPRQAHMVYCTPANWLIVQPFAPTIAMDGLVVHAQSNLTSCVSQCDSFCYIR